MSKYQVKTWAQLDASAQGGCNMADCLHLDHSQLYMRSVCHPEAGVEVFYDRNASVLVIECSACKAVVFALGGDV